MKSNNPPYHSSNHETAVVNDEWLIDHKEHFSCSQVLRSAVRRPELHPDQLCQDLTTCSISSLVARLDHFVIHLSQAVYQFVL